MLQGSIHDFGLVDILQLIGLQKKTGFLEIQKGQETAFLFFEEGQILYASSSIKGDTEKIGQILLKSGKITEAQLQSAMERQIQEARQGEQRIGQVLEELAFVRRDDVAEALQFQVKEILFNLFRWKEGTYRFETQHLNFDKAYYIPLPTEFLLMESLRMLDEWPYIEKKIPSHRVIFGKVLGSEEEAQPYHVPEEERVYMAVDGTKNVSEVIEELQIGEFETCKILANLLVSGLIQEIAVSRDPVGAESERDSILRRVNRRLAYLVQWPVVIAGLGTIFWTGFPFSIFDVKEIKPFYNEIAESITLHRIDRVDHSVKLYFLKNGRLPEDLRDLVREGWLTRREIRDVQGIPFQLQKEAQGYRLVQSRL
jgi:hypothetical protein